MSSIDDNIQEIIFYFIDHIFYNNKKIFPLSRTVPLVVETKGVRSDSMFQNF